MYQNSSSLSHTISNSTLEILSADWSKGAGAFSFLPGKAADSADCLIVRGELDIGVNSRLRSVFASLKPSAKLLVIDLIRVTHIGCSSLRLLFHARHTLSRERPVAYCLDTDSQVWRMIRILRMEEYFPIVAPSNEWNQPAVGDG